MSGSSVPNAVLEKLPGALFQAMSGMWPALLFVLATAFLVRFLRSPKVKGRIGEAVVAVGALGKLDPVVYRVFNDIVLPRPDGKGTTQIDHVVVSPFGIFVIETKNYAGWIFGDETSRYWTQVIHGKKSRFQNPLHQNALHVRALANAAGLSKDCFRNLVYFVGEATLKSPLPPQVMTEGLAGFVQNFQVEVLPQEGLARVVAVLEQALSERREGRRAHRAQVGAS